MCDDICRIGFLAIAARPLGGNWLPGEIRSWQRARIALMCSTLAHKSDSTGDCKFAFLELSVFFSDERAAFEIQSSFQERQLDGRAVGAIPDAREEHSVEPLRQ
jgi:hypothetical protein